MVTQITLNTEPRGFDSYQGHSYGKADMGYPGLIFRPWLAGGLAPGHSESGRLRVSQAHGSLRSRTEPHFSQVMGVYRIVVG